MANTLRENGTPFRLLPAAIAIALLAAACGGGGGGGGDDSTPTPPPVGPGDTEGFFPDSIGDAWFYDTTVGDESEPTLQMHGFSEMTVTGTRSFGSVAAKVFATASPDDPGSTYETYYAKDDNAVTNYGNNDPSDTLTAAIVPYVEGRFPVAPGVITSISRTGVDYGEDLDGDGRHETVDFTMRITMDGFEALTVPAGSFDRTAKRTSSISGTLRTTRSGSLPFTATEQLWSAPGAGVIKQVSTVAASGVSEQVSSLARGYKVGGVPHGLGLPDEFLGSLTSDDTRVPTSASDGSDGFLVAGVRQTSDAPIASKIVAAFGDADGHLVREFDVTSPSTGYVQGIVGDAAFDGTNYLLLYSNGTGDSTPNPLLATRISRSGQVLDPVPIAIDTGSVWMAAVAYGNSNYLVVFTRYDNTLGRHLLYGRLVTPAGVAVGAGPFPIGPRDQNELYPDVAFDGTNFLVAWQQQPGTASDPPDISIAAARVSEAGVVVDPNGFPVSDTGHGSYTPRVAFGGGQYFVTWQDGRNTANYTEGFDIYGARIDPNGVLLDGAVETGGLRISGYPMPEAGYPRATWTDSGFLVTWTAYGIYAPIPQAGVFASRVSPTGVVSRGGGDYGICLSGQHSASRYQYASPLRLGSRVVVTWRDGTGVREVPVYSLD